MTTLTATAPKLRAWQIQLLAVAAIVFLTVLAYYPVLHAGFIWDDDSYLTENPLLNVPNALYYIWFVPRMTPQYYPAVFTTFYFEKMLWGLNPMGYHAVNVLLHSANAVLVYFLARRVRLPVPLLIALLFALHPVQQESVAWITERKNVLSLFFYLGSLSLFLTFAQVRSTAKESLVWLGESDRFGAGFLTVGFWVAAVILGNFLVDKAWKFEFPSVISAWFTAAIWLPCLFVMIAVRSWRLAGLYVAALVCYVLALLSKSVACSLPVTIALILWWQDRLDLRRLKSIVHWAVLILPFLAIGLGLGLNTAMLEKTHVGADGPEFAFSRIDRVLIAGRALCFYAYKILVPLNLSFYYERWRIDSHVWWQYIFPAVAAAVLVVLAVSIRRLGKGPLAAVLGFAAAVFPALGFFNIYPFVFSFVADHFQYFGTVFLIVLFAAGLLHLAGRFFGASGVRVATLSLGLVVASYLVLDWFTLVRFRNNLTVWAGVLQNNPDHWSAVSAVACELAKEGDVRARAGDVKTARECFQSAIEDQRRSLAIYYATFGRDQAEIRANLGCAQLTAGMFEARLGHGQAAAEDFDAALASILAARKLAPNHARFAENLASVYVQMHRKDDAIAALQDAIRCAPAYFPAYLGLGALLLEQERFEEAAEAFRRATVLCPDAPEAWAQLGRAQVGLQRMAEGMASYERALRLAPDHVAACVSLTDAILKLPDASRAQLQRALDVASRANALTHERNGIVLDTLSLAYERNGQRDQAVRSIRQALALTTLTPARRAKLEERLASLTGAGTQGKLEH